MAVKSKAQAPAFAFRGSDLQCGAAQQLRNEIAQEGSLSVDFGSARQWYREEVGCKRPSSSEGKQRGPTYTNVGRTDAIAARVAHLGTLGDP